MSSDGVLLLSFRGVTDIWFVNESASGGGGCTVSCSAYRRWLQADERGEGRVRGRVRGER